MFFIDLIHYLVFGGFLAFQFYRIKRLQRVTLLHFSSSFFVLFAVLFFPLTKYQEFTVTDVTVALRALYVGVMFISGCILADRLYYRKTPRTRNIQVKPTLLFNYALAFFFLFALAGVMRLYFVGGAYRHVGEVAASIGDAGEYYASRDSLSDWMLREKYLGVSHSAIAMVSVLPTLSGVALLIYSQTKILSYRVIFLASSLMAILIVSVFIERTAVLFAISYPIIFVVLVRNPAAIELKFLRRVTIANLLVLTFAVVGMGMVAYSVTDGIGFVAAAELALQRIFVVPCLTSSYYYGAFPEHFAFRGITTIFHIGAVSDFGGVSTRDIAQFGTQYYTMNANSGFLATAYSGAGYLGCAVVTLCYLAITVSVDRFLESQPGYLRALNIFVNLYGFITLSNTPLGVALTTGGFGMPSLILIILVWAGQLRKDWI